MVLFMQFGGICVDKVGNSLYLPTRVYAVGML